jgi:hypothetical protein
MSTATETAFAKLLGFLDRLDAAGIGYRLNHVRDSLMVEVAMPGERWEVEFFEDGHVEVERFRSGGEIEGESALDGLFTDPDGDRSC